MLQELYVENFALIDKLSLPLGSGLNVLTGETGAGKSLLLDAVSLLIGGRAQEQFIRDGYEKCLVEGIFSLPCPNEVEKLLEENGIKLEDDTIILSREYFRSAKNSCRINGRAIPLSLLRKIGRSLINIHGQMEHMLLLEEETQSQLLDSFGGEEILSQKQRVAESFLMLADLKRKAKAYEEEKQERAQRIDWLKFQIKEIDGANIDIAEAEELEKEKTRLVHGEKLLSGAAGAAKVAERAWDLIAEGVSSLKISAALDDEAAQLEESLNDIYYNLEDFTRAIGDFRDSINMDPRRLDEVENRLAHLSSLCKKYGTNLNAVLAYKNKAQNQLDSLMEMELMGSQFQEEYEKGLVIYQELASALSILRKDAAKELGLAITQELRQLYMANASLEIGLTPCGLSENGVERAVFLIQSNTGEKFQPVSKIASGGELSRVVLAIKVILAKLDQVPTLIFDEVDSGLGGRALNAVARKMAFVGQSSQVLCVTHAPLMAAAAGHHINIFKKISENRTIIQAQVLEGEKRVQEISRMIAGDNISSSTLAQARDMLA